MLWFLFLKVAMSEGMPALAALVKPLKFTQRPGIIDLLYRFAVFFFSHENDGRSWDSGCKDLGPTGPLRVSFWTPWCSQGL